MSLAFNKGPRAEHLTRGQSGVPGEVGKLRKDTAAAFDALEKMLPHVMQIVAPASFATLANGIKTTFASVAAPLTLVATDFDGVLAPGTGPAIINAPRKVTLTVGGGGTPANWTGGTVTFVGTDADGHVQSEDVVSAAGAGTTTTTKYFATLTQVQIPTQGGTAAQLTLGVLADTGSIISLASSTSAQVIDGTAASLWNRTRTGNRTMPFGRRISFVFSSAASWITSTITVVGRDIRGKKISETIAVPNGGGSTVTTNKHFVSIESISIPAQGAALGTCQVGPLEGEAGLDLDPISPVEAVALLREASRADGASAWSVPTTGVLDDSSVSTAQPYGAYTPDSSVAMNGVREYVVAYLPKAA